MSCKQFFAIRPFLFFFLTSQQLTAKVDRYTLYILDHPETSIYRTGCPECYGKLNCGCPDCYVPEFKRGKKKRVSIDLESVVLLPRLEYSICTVSRVEEEGRVTLTKVTKPIVCTQVRLLSLSCHRLSSSFSILIGGARSKKTRIYCLEDAQPMEPASDPCDNQGEREREDS